MQILLKQQDLEQAVKNYIRDMGIGRPVSNIEFSQTRSPATTNAEITLQPLAGVTALTRVDKPVGEVRQEEMVDNTASDDDQTVQDIASETVQTPDDEVEVPAKTTNKKLFG
jgi:hypothetical protein